MIDWRESIYWQTITCIANKKGDCYYLSLFSSNAFLFTSGTAFFSCTSFSFCSRFCFLWWFWPRPRPRFRWPTRWRFISTSCTHRSRRCGGLWHFLIILFDLDWYNHFILMLQYQDLIDCSDGQSIEMKLAVVVHCFRTHNNQ